MLVADDVDTSFVNVYRAFSFYYVQVVKTRVIERRVEFLVERWNL